MRDRDNVNQQIKRSVNEMNLIKYDAAVKALAEAHAVDEVKDMHDKAVAVQAYARQAKDETLINYANEIKNRAARKGGELLKEMKERGELFQGGRPSEKEEDCSIKNLSSADDRLIGQKTTTLEELGISRNQSSEWQQLAEVPEDEFEDYIQECKEENKQPPIKEALKVIKEKLNEGRLTGEALEASRRNAKAISKRAQLAGQVYMALEELDTYPLTVEELLERKDEIFQNTGRRVDEHIVGAADFLARFAEGWLKGKEMK